MAASATMTTSATKASLCSMRDSRRKDALRTLRAMADAVAAQADGRISALELLLQDREFAGGLFSLFDREMRGRLRQDDLFEGLRISVRSAQLSHVALSSRLETVELLESLSYAVCLEADLDAEAFRRVVSGRGVAARILVLADVEARGSVTTEQLVALFIVLAKPRYPEDFNPAQVKLLEETFRQTLPPDKTHLTLREFKKMMPTKNEFFVERVFHVVDQDGNGEISLAEFVDSMDRFSRRDPHEKIAFLFSIYDIDGDGRLQQREMEAVMRACVSDSGMDLPDSDVRALAAAIFDEAAGDGHQAGDQICDDRRHIDIEQLKNAFAKHPGLIENLTFSLSSWLLPSELPSPKPKSKTKSLLRLFSLTHLLSQWQLSVFLLAVFAANVIVAAVRAAEFRGFRNADGSAPNPFYMISRACGRCLLLDSVLVIAVVLRYTVTKLRNLKASEFLPLDHNIYIHKVLGVTIFLLSLVHTVMHICNFTLNVSPDPVRFSQLNSHYWDVAHLSDDDETKPNWQRLGYQLPDGCNISTECGSATATPMSTASSNAQSSRNNVTYCQVCSPGSGPWALSDWLLTTKPGVFGLVGGAANPSGLALVGVVGVMTACSLPCVRRSGYFQVFYISHLLYWAYLLLLILHAPDFWKWALVPVLALSAEKAYRAASTAAGKGRSVVVHATTMASRVTKLVILRPDGFKFKAGDWVFVRVPRIAASEWHPFTISSAPEQRDTVTLHVRAVGGWTNKLYDLFEDRKQRSAGANAKRLSRGRSLQATIGTMEDSAAVKELATAVSVFEEEIGTALDGFQEENIEIHLDGPFGAPASNLFRSEHAVLIATGIGVTPFSSILQSIMCRYLETKRVCPNCAFKWNHDLAKSMIDLKKVDFFWINRSQRSFEWFISQLEKMEAAQAEDDGAMNKLLEFHLYFTSALQSSDMRGVALQLAMDVLHEKAHRDLMTGLRVRTKAGRPNWNVEFSKLREARRGHVTVFFCGSPKLAKVLRAKCEQFGFAFRKEVFQ